MPLAAEVTVCADHDRVGLAAALAAAEAGHVHLVQRHRGDSDFTYLAVRAHPPLPNAAGAPSRPALTAKEPFMEKCPVVPAARHAAAALDRANIRKVA